MWSLTSLDALLERYLLDTLSQFSMSLRSNRTFRGDVPGMRVAGKANTAAGAAECGPGRNTTFGS